jgi:DNA-binding Xre family transcriptional regulator
MLLYVIDSHISMSSVKGVALVELEKTQGDLSMIRLRVADVARQQGMSMGRLSRKSDVSYRTIKLIFSNPEMSITTHTLNKLAGALGVPASELIETLPDPPGGE